MISTHDPTAEETLERHRQLLCRLIEAVREGTIHAQEYSDWQDEEMDRTLAPSLVRKGAKRMLAKRNTEGLEIREDEYTTEYQSNLGILVVASNGDRFRVLKSDQDSIPVPGDSLSRQAFYQQQMSLFPAANGDDSSERVFNFVLHWTADEEYNLNRVHLACPRAGAKTRDSVDVYFDDIVWRRKHIVSGQQTEAEVEDLDLYIEGDQTGTGNAE